MRPVMSHDFVGVNNELGRIQRKWLLPNLRHYTGICLYGVRITTRNLRKDNLVLRPESNGVPTKYNSDAIPPQPNAWFFSPLESVTVGGINISAFNKTFLHTEAALIQSALGSSGPRHNGCCNMVMNRMWVEEALYLGTSGIWATCQQLECSPGPGQLRLIVFQFMVSTSTVQYYDSHCVHFPRLLSLSFQTYMAN
jgi:hypothetical protein